MGIEEGLTISNPCPTNEGNFGLILRESNINPECRAKDKRPRKMWRRNVVYPTSYNSAAVVAELAQSM